MKRTLFINKTFILIILISVMTSCSGSAYINFEGDSYQTLVELNRNHNISAVKEDRVLILAGDGKFTTEFLALTIAESLKKNSIFNVIERKEIKDKIAHYPAPIAGPYNRVLVELEINLSWLNLKKIKSIMEKLKADYLYMVWMPLITESSYSENTLMNGYHLIFHLKGDKLTRVAQGKCNLEFNKEDYKNTESTKKFIRRMEKYGFQIANKIMSITSSNSF